MTDQPSAQETWASRLVALTPLRLAIFIALGTWFMGVWLTEPNTFGMGHDWTYFTHHATVGWKSFVEYGQLPQWNPYWCGGIPGLGNVQVDTLSPDFALTWIFGLEEGLRLRMLLMLVLGMEGLYRLARHHDSTPLSAALAGMLFATSGRFVQLFADGQPAFFGFELVPWLLLGLEKAYDRPRWAVLGGVAMTWIFFHGGAIATPCCVVTVGLIATRDALVRGFTQPPAGTKRLAWMLRPYRALALIGALTAVFAAIRLLPVAESILAHPRAWYGNESYALGHVLLMFFGPPTSSGYVDAGTSYLGVATGVLFLVAFYARDKKAILYLVTFVLVVDLAMGMDGPLQLWRLVHGLPILKDFRNPFRFTFIGALFLALGAARGVTLVERALITPTVVNKLVHFGERLGAFGRTVMHRKTLAGVAALMMLAGTYALVRHGTEGNRTRLQGLPRREIGAWAEGHFRQSLGNRWAAQLWPRLDLGSIGCFEEQPFPTSKKLRADLQQEEYFADSGGVGQPSGPSGVGQPSGPSGGGTVERIGWSPNRIVLDVDTPGGGRLFVNQNWHRGWSSDVGTVVSDDGLLAVDVPPGHHTLTLSFNDPLIIVGGTISALALLGSAWVLLRLRRRDRADADATTATRDTDTVNAS